MNVKMKKVSIFGKDSEPKQGVSNEYPTSHFMIRQPCLMYVSSVRNTGKSYCVSTLVRQAQKEKIFDKIYMITPTFDSNRSYFGDMVSEEDVFEPDRLSVEHVIKSVELDRDDWEEFLENKKRHKRMLDEELTEDDLLDYYEMGLIDEKGNITKPKWKYHKERPPQSLLIMDDVLSSPALLQGSADGSGITKVATLNRHIAQLKEPSHDRSACGLAVIIISQTYSMPQGVSRTLRENLTHLLIFKNKQEKQLNKIREELGSAVDEGKFQQAYELATKEKYGNLLVDFNPKCPTMTFRKNLNELIVFDDAECACPK